MNAKPRPMLFLAMACLALLIGGGANYWQYSQFQDAQSEAKNLDTKLKNAKAIQEELQGSVLELAASSEKLKHLEMSVPEIAYVPTLLTELETVGKQHGIRVMGVRPLAPKQEPVEKGVKRPKKAYEEIDIEVKGKGKYAAVLQFLSALRRFPKIVSVKTTTLTPKREIKDIGAPNLELTVELRAFLFPPAKSSTPETLKNGEQQLPKIGEPAASKVGGSSKNGIG